MKPSVGRIVHYVSHGTPIREDGSQAFPSVCRAALITEVGAWMDEPSDATALIRDAVRDSLVAADASPDLLAKADAWKWEMAGMRLALQVWRPDACHLDVHNPTGDFKNVCQHDEGNGPGTWHWPERETE